ncbi:MAG: aminopeptidase N C-terminal domain-containing protein, partial [Pseudomonadota bacterium]
PDPTEIHAAREKLTRLIAEHLEADLPRIFEAMRVPGPYTPNSKAAGCRTLRQTVLALWARRDGGKAAEKLFADADNMTEQLGALGTLMSIGRGQPEAEAFYKQWHEDRLVMDKWFSLQAMYASPDVAAERASELTEHPLFDWKNPNRFRSVIGGLVGNPAGFHHPSGAGYRFVADWLIKLDPLNPQTAARMSTVFETWRRYDADRQGMIEAELRRIGATPLLSRDTTEMVSRIRGA